MAKFGFNDDELSKLFADAGAAVKKVKETPQKAEEEAAPVEAPHETSPPPRAPAFDPFAQASHQEPAAPPRREEAAPQGAIKATQVIGGALEDAQMQAMLRDRSMVTIPYKAVKSLALGRVEDGQMIGWTHGSTVYFMSDKNVSYKGLIHEVAPMAIQNWRALLNELSQKIGLTADTGIQALSTPGGLIPKYLTQEDFFRALQKLA